MKIYCIGIGGIGVSALAKYYLEKGGEILGSDLKNSEIVEELKKKGVKVFVGKHDAKNLPEDLDLVVYSPAIDKKNPELKKAFFLSQKNPKLKVLSYPQALGEITKRHFTIAVCGTHGKSTTTALIGLILVQAKLDPTVIVGTKVKEFSNSNCRIGKSKYLVIEADEHFASFLNYWPKIIVLTSLEPDHLDFYKNFENYKKAFKEFVFHLPKDGALVANKDDKEIFKIFKNKKKVKFYSLKEKIAAKIKKVLKVPGLFNVQNALAAFKVAEILKIKRKICFSVFKNFEGTWRRFQVEKKKVFGKEIFVVHDYAHHPTEVLVTLKAAKEHFQGQKIFAIFQPHQYQRTFYLWQDFLEKLKKVPVEKLVLIDIFSVAGRENAEIKRKVNAKKLAKELKKEDPEKFYYFPTLKKALSFLKKFLEKESALFLLGAGDIYEKAKSLLK